MAHEQPPRSPLALVRPSWMDPRYVGAVAKTVQSIVQFPGSTVVPILTNNPLRIAFGVSTSAMLTSATYFGIDSRPFDRPVFNVFTKGWEWLSLFEYGPLITGEWWGYSSDVLDLVVTEIVLYQ